MTDVDTRRAYLSPSAGPFYMAEPGVFHMTRPCAARGTGGVDLVRETYLEKAVKEGYEPCGICATGVEWGG